MAKNRGYKRRWRNLLLNRRYQLSFTMVLVGMAALLMVALGWWVKQVASSATQVAVHSVVESRCPPNPDEDPSAVPKMMPAKQDAMDLDEPEPEPDEAAPPEEAAADRPAAPDEAETEAAADATEDTEAAAGEETEQEPKSRVILGESRIEEIEPVVDVAALEKARAAYRRCQEKQDAAKDELWGNYHLILYVLAGTTLLLVVGLGFYGIKMTHRVAGPLHKVGLYLDKMAAGKYDPVYNLRKGDQLGEFYEHFKAAHTGMVQMQREDIAVLEEAVRELEAALAALDAPPAELEQATAELAELLAEKKANLSVEEDGNG